jgi:hypothetical protein
MLLDKSDWWAYLVVFVHIIKLTPPTSYLCFQIFFTNFWSVISIFHDKSVFRLKIFYTELIDIKNINRIFEVCSNKYKLDQAKTDADDPCEIIVNLYYEPHFIFDALHKLCSFWYSITVHC